MLIQTQDVVRDLLASGLERKDFQARCQRIMHGRVFVGYGDVEIILWCSLERQWEVAPELAKRFKVLMHMDKGKPRGCLIVEEAKGSPGLTKREW